MTLTQQGFAATMADFFGGLGGPVGVYVDSLDTDLVLSYNADQMYPTASTLKVPVLYELYRQADAGEVNLSDRMTLSHSNRVPGSGILQDLDDGLQPTIRDLAELMIIVSDNWATDLLYDIIGKEPLAATMQELGLNNTFIPLTIREMFSAMAEVDPTDPSVDYQFLKDVLKHRTATEDNVAFACDSRNDVSTPADMGRLMRLIHECHGLSAEGREGVLKILKDQNFNTRIPARLPVDQDIEVAHKTGSIRGVANDVGIVYSPQVNYIIAMMSVGQDDSAETTDRLARASRWIWDQLTAE
ncbi:MAG: serine hydrolase [Thermomicrobiales bacterium]|nr:serine hydrolase [Thermomicrobiales bacterium]